MPRLRRLPLPGSRGHAVPLAVFSLPAGAPAGAGRPGGRPAADGIPRRSANGAHGADGQSPDMDAARNAPAAAESIVLRSGATVDMTPLLSDDAPLTAAESLARETALQQLDESVSDRTAERLSVLDTVLAGPAFQQSESLLDRLRRWLAELLARFFPDTDMPGTINPAASTAVEVVGLGRRGRCGDRAAPAAEPLAAYPVARAFVGDATLAAAGETGDPATAAEARRGWSIRPGR